MRKVLLIMALSTSLAAAGARANPFFETWDTPFGVPPFDRITTEDFEPAFMQGMADHTVEIAAIAADPSAATFANTIEALDTSGALLSRVSMVFSCLIGALTNDELQEVARELAPQRSRHRDEINLNEALFARVNAVYDQREQLDLNPEQRRLLSETWKGFVRGGALLGDPEKEKLKELNQELSVLSLKFGENVLKETNRFEYVVGERAKLDGLPDGVIAAAAETAAERGHPGQWAFTIQKPSLLPFLQFSTDRQAREKMLTAYTQKGNHGDELDNNGILARMAVLRAERAHLLGFDSHAAYVLDDNMAKTPDAVYKLLDQVWWPAQKKSKEEAGRLQGMIDAEDGGFELQPCDWWYYTEKLRKQDFDLEESMRRPNFELESVRAGGFETEGRR